MMKLAQCLTLYMAVLELKFSFASLFMPKRGKQNKKEEESKEW